MILFDGVTKRLIFYCARHTKGYTYAMETVKKYREKALFQYEDLRDTIAVIEAMQLQDSKPGVSWNNLKKKLHAKSN